MIHHVNQQLQGFRMNTRMPLCQCVHTQQHHDFHNVQGQQFTSTHRMGHDEVLLQLCTLFFRNSHIAEIAKSGGNTIHYFLLINPLVNQFSGTLNLFLCSGCERNRNIILDKIFNLFKGQGITVK